MYDVTRGLMERLRPVADELGLADALRHLVSEWQRRNPGVGCSLEFQGRLEGLGEQINMSLYRVVQECLTNVTRHARASAVEVRVEARPAAGVRIRDDGGNAGRDGLDWGSSGSASASKRWAVASRSPSAHRTASSREHPGRAVNSKTALRVLLVDDHAVVREGYRRLLERTSDIEVIAEARTGDAAYRLFCDTAPDVVVMDIRCPVVSGVESACASSPEPSARVLVFSVHEDVVFASGRRRPVRGLHHRRARPS